MKGRDANKDLFARSLIASGWSVRTARAQAKIGQNSILREVQGPLEWLPPMWPFKGGARGATFARAATARLLQTNARGTSRQIEREFGVCRRTARKYCDSAQKANGPTPCEAVFL